MSVIIPNQKKLDQTISNIKQAGKDKLHILADFDRTLTYSSVDGQKIPSIIAVLRNGQYLTSDYAKQAHTLFDKYHPIEIDPNIKLADKKLAMDTWWRTHKQLLIESGLNKNDIVEIIKDRNIKFRQGVNKFVDYLHTQNIPLLILSASGVGEAVPLYFQNAKQDYANIHYITNSLNWDDKGNAISIKEPIIHSLNKDETIVKNFPKIYKEIVNRKNVILLGDNLADIDMITGFDYDNLIKIGFLNYDDTKIKKQFLENFDIIIENDGDFESVNKLIMGLYK
ncbi:MAG: hypothetical protein HOE19_00660 [Candidatus Komeilibacteria bacterium]|jgi:cytosolic 5'-nucleotidase 3|nr:hypothetical protein [Candidatus Komeilibacteria bacterium]MBT4447359.1 hypothetical protein [Candidatus Komeilibacteria bacterium]